MTTFTAVVVAANLTTLATVAVDSTTFAAVVGAAILSPFCCCFDNVCCCLLDHFVAVAANLTELLMGSTSLGVFLTLFVSLSRGFCFNTVVMSSRLERRGNIKIITCISLYI